MKEGLNPENRDRKTEVSQEEDKLLKKMSASEQAMDILRKSKHPLWHALAAVFDLYVPRRSRREEAFLVLCDHFFQEVDATKSLADERLVKELLSACCQEDAPIDLLFREINDKAAVHFPSGQSAQEENKGIYLWKRAMDLERLGEIEEKQNKGEASLSRGDLSFIYEIYGQMFLTGAAEIKRLAALRVARSAFREQDVLAVFECKAGEIARAPNEINERTKVYIGNLVHRDEWGNVIPIFQRLQHVEHIYTKFPEQPIRRYGIEMGGKDEQEIEELLTRNAYGFDSVAFIFGHDDFKRSLRLDDPKQPDGKLKSQEEATLIRLSVEDLGFPKGSTTEQIYARAQQLGLELCSPEVGPQFRLQCVNQPMNKYLHVGMKQILGTDGYPYVFSVGRDGDGPWLSYDWAEPTREWSAGHEFVFRLRKKSSKP